MTKEEQIKEMFNIIADGVIENNNSILTRNTCASIAKALYAEGYHKQNEVAREIFEKIEDCMSCFEDDDDGYLLKKCEFEFFMRELKKEIYGVSDRGCDK